MPRIRGHKFVPLRKVVKNPEPIPPPSPAESHKSSTPPGPLRISGFESGSASPLTERSERPQLSVPAHAQSGSESSSVGEGANDNANESGNEGTPPLPNAGEAVESTEGSEKVDPPSDQPQIQTASSARDQRAKARTARITAAPAAGSGQQKRQRVEIEEKETVGSSKAEEGRANKRINLPKDPYYDPFLRLEDSESERREIPTSGNAEEETAQNARSPSLQTVIQPHPSPLKENPMTVTEEIPVEDQADQDLGPQAAALDETAVPQVGPENEENIKVDPKWILGPEDTLFSLQQLISIDFLRAVANDKDRPIVKYENEKAESLRAFLSVMKVNINEGSTVGDGWRALLRLGGPEEVAKTYYELRECYAAGVGLRMARAKGKSGRPFENTKFYTISKQVYQGKIQRQTVIDSLAEVLGKIKMVKEEDFHNITRIPFEIAVRACEENDQVSEEYRNSDILNRVNLKTRPATGTIIDDVHKKLLISTLLGNELTVIAASIRVLKITRRVQDGEIDNQAGDNKRNGIIGALRQGQLPNADLFKDDDVVEILRYEDAFEDTVMIPHLEMEEPIIEDNAMTFPPTTPQVPPKSPQERQRKVLTKKKNLGVRSRKVRFIGEPYDLKTRVPSKSDKRSTAHYAKYIRRLDKVIDFHLKKKLSILKIWSSILRCRGSTLEFIANAYFQTRRSVYRHYYPGSESYSIGEQVEQTIIANLAKELENLKAHQEDADLPPPPLVKVIRDMNSSNELTKYLLEQIFFTSIAIDPAEGVWLPGIPVSDIPNNILFYELETLAGLNRVVVDREEQLKKDEILGFKDELSQEGEELQTLLHEIEEGSDDGGEDEDETPEQMVKKRLTLLSTFPDADEEYNAAVEKNLGPAHVGTQGIRYRAGQTTLDNIWTRLLGTKQLGTQLAARFYICAKSAVYKGRFRSCDLNFNQEERNLLIESLGEELDEYNDMGDFFLPFEQTIYMEKSIANLGGKILNCPLVTGIAENPELPGVTRDELLGELVRLEFLTMALVENLIYLWQDRPAKPVTNDDIVARGENMQALLDQVANEDKSRQLIYRGWYLFDSKQIGVFQEHKDDDFELEGEGEKSYQKNKSLPKMNALWLSKKVARTQTAGAREMSESTGRDSLSDDEFVEALKLKRAKVKHIPKGIKP